MHELIVWNRYGYAGTEWISFWMFNCLRTMYDSR